MVGHEPNGELAGLPEPFRSMGEHLANVDVDDALTGAARQEALAVARAPLWRAMLAALPDHREALTRALADADPLGPAPTREAVAQFATLADIARIVSAQPWLWPGWIASHVLNAVAAEPGVGKTRFALDLARRLWFKLAWPDGQENTWPERTRTLWVQGDRNFAEMLQAARDFGLPDEAVALGAPPDDPTGGLDLDDPLALEELAGRIRAAAPALVIIDTVGMTTGRNLCRPEEARAFFAPIIELARDAGVAVLGLTHLSANKEALGRRIVEKARVVIKMTQPDPEGQPDRRRLWVDKTAVIKPPPLGITMKGDGNEYDFVPPVEPQPEARRPGPRPAKLDACKQWLAKRLTPNPARVSELRTEAEKEGYPPATLYRAREEMGVDEYMMGSRKWWRLPGAPSVRVVRDDDSL
jgi:hypothetical protein